MAKWARNSFGNVDADDGGPSSVLSRMPGTMAPGLPKRFSVTGCLKAPGAAASEGDSRSGSEDELLPIKRRGAGGSRRVGALAMSSDEEEGELQSAAALRRQREQRQTTTAAPPLGSCPLNGAFGGAQGSQYRPRRGPGRRSLARGSIRENGCASVERAADADRSPGPLSKKELLAPEIALVFGRHKLKPRRGSTASRLSASSGGGTGGSTAAAATGSPASVKGAGAVAAPSSAGSAAKKSASREPSVDSLEAFANAPTPRAARNTDAQPGSPAHSPEPALNTRELLAVCRKVAKTAREEQGPNLLETESESASVSPRHRLPFSMSPRRSPGRSPRRRGGYWSSESFLASPRPPPPAPPAAAPAAASAAPPLGTWPKMHSAALGKLKMRASNLF
eukprot:TRINITY_DN25723_c0_g1_i1.p1 TRINITY_DN25723_c0_g1~~TRINITY_DN25723_c0_g1_i1.p1  ORF type:complete len:394 (+),score=69.44 TRINITY_DN25723_c0_g1_i1:180-1361(+)